MFIKLLSVLGLYRDEYGFRLRADGVRERDWILARQAFHKYDDVVTQPDGAETYILRNVQQLPLSKFDSKERRFLVNRCTSIYATFKDGQSPIVRFSTDPTA